MSSQIIDCNSACELDETISKARKARFWEKKKILDSLVPDGNENTSIPISLDLFAALIESFGKNSDVYTGIRIYYATYSDEGSKYVPKGQGGKLTVLIVPTLKGNQQDGTPFDQDDINNYYHLYDNNLTKLDAPKTPVSTDDIVSTWINNYRNKKHSALQVDGERAAGSRFTETLSLWYPLFLMCGGKDESGRNEIGMAGFIRCGQKNMDNPIVKLTLFFGAFLERELHFPYNYQMTLIFELHQKKDSEDGSGYVISFGSSRPSGFLRPTDTGLPCPPNGYCPVPYNP